MTRPALSPEAAFQLGKAAGAITLARDSMKLARGLGAFDHDPVGLADLLLGQLDAIANYLFELGHDHEPPADNVKPRVRGAGGFGSTGDS